jgi:hypothetical protein
MGDLFTEAANERQAENAPLSIDRGGSPSPSSAWWLATSAP